MCDSEMYNAQYCSHANTLQMTLTNDLVNPNSGGPLSFDPRHMYGVTNQVRSSLSYRVR